MPVTATAKVSTSATITQSVLGNFTGRPSIDYERKLGQADVSKCYAGSRSTAAPDSLDVTALTDPYGTSIAFSVVKVVQIQNTHATASLTVDGNLIGSDVITVGPGRCLFVDTSRTVDGSHKILTVTPSTGTVTYDVILLGS